MVSRILGGCARNVAESPDLSVCPVKPSRWRALSQARCLPDSSRIYRRTERSSQYSNARCLVLSLRCKWFPQQKRRLGIRQKLSFACHAGGEFGESRANRVEMHRRQRNAEGGEDIRVSPTEMRKASFFWPAQHSAQPSPWLGASRGRCQDLNGLGSHTRREAALHRWHCWRIPIPRVWAGVCQMGLESRQSRLWDQSQLC